MKKMFKFLENVSNYNNFYEVDTFEHVNGNQQDIYLRLISKFSGNQCNSNSLRYVPSSIATMQVRFDSLDKAAVVIRFATMSFLADDRSIWKVTLLPGDVISGSVSVVLTDGAVVETILLEGRLVASGTDTSKFFC